MTSQFLPFSRSNLSRSVMSQMKKILLFSHHWNFRILRCFLRSHYFLIGPCLACHAILALYITFLILWFLIQAGNMVKKQCKNKWKTAKDGIKSVRADLADILKGKVERYYFVNSQRKPCFFYCGCKLFSNLRRLLVGGLLSFLL